VRINDSFLAEGADGAGVGQHLGDGSGGEGLFNGPNGIVEFAVERAQVDAVRFEPERAVVDAAQRVDCGDHVEHGDLGGWAGKDEPASASALSGYESDADQRL
jgi:hypothetical protein